MGFFICQIFVSTLIVHSMAVDITDGLVTVFHSRSLRSYQRPETKTMFLVFGSSGCSHTFRAAILVRASFMVSVTTTPRIKLHTTDISHLQISSPLSSVLENNWPLGPNNISIVDILSPPYCSHVTTVSIRSFSLKNSLPWQQ